MLNLGLMEIRLVSASIFVLAHVILFIAFVLNRQEKCRTRQDVLHFDELDLKSIFSKSISSSFQDLFEI